VLSSEMHDFTIYDGRGESQCSLSESLGPVREIGRDLRQQRSDGIRIEDVDIGDETFTQQPSL
jgi:hypothetical protein